MEQHQALEQLSALAHATRLDIFRLLVRAGPAGLPAGAIGDELAVAAPTLSFHLKELRQAGLIASERDGRSQIYRAEYPAMNALLSYLSEECCRGSGCAPSPSPTPTPTVHENRS